jgi:hypothetical protein
MVNTALIPLVIPRSEKTEMKPPYVCPGCSNHTYNNNMINRCHVRSYRVIISYIMTRGSEENTSLQWETKRGMSLHRRRPMETPNSYLRDQAENLDSTP